MSTPEKQAPNLEGVAIIGMAGRFPGARSVAGFWRNQLGGLEAISHFRAEDLQLRQGGELSSHPNYVRARSVLDDVELFDAEFFGMYPREAELTDPQHRLFLECCWQAFEDAGYDPGANSGTVGVYAGCSMGTYFLGRLCARPGFIEGFTGGYQVEHYPEMLGNNLDFLATRVSYKLNLRGPSFTLQCGCSTSLLAVTQACQSLLTYQCDMALAGGASVTFPQQRGSHYQEGGMISPDGHCRTFDANAAGTVFGSGVAVVLLKRLDDALQDGDQVYAVIRGFGVNNDGSAKVGYTAPSVEGQARVITLAQQAAGVHPETIGYIEAHGTGTPLGDPIELAALTQAFGARTGRKQFCVVGTAKTNVGHLDIAAGVTGLIHAAHIVREGVYPPTLHYSAPNPKFDLQSSPFFVNTARTEWKSGTSPRRAGVSAFGVGGTNAHVILEEPPTRTSTPSTRPVLLFPLSARSEAALEKATDQLAQHLQSRSGLNPADAAWTLQTGRRAFACRRTVVARDAAEAISRLAVRDRQYVQSRMGALDKPEVCFLFPGQGSQHPNMAREIYETEPAFREAVDRCTGLLTPQLGADLCALLYPPEGASEGAKRRVTDTVVAQPAIFTVEYALAQLWMSWGIQPQAMLGHSIGEFVAACLAGVFSLEDALSLVAARGVMMQELPAGGMLSVRLQEAQLRPRLNGHLSLAAVNSPSLCVVSGSLEALQEFERELAAEGVACRRLVTSHAFHSRMMDPIIEPFTRQARKVALKVPRIPYISGVTGTWITEAEATSPEYWARHFREPVLFSAGVTELRRGPNRVLLEVGPGNVLSTLTRQHPGASPEQAVVASLSDDHSGAGDAESLMNALGALWVAGVQPNWSAVHAGEGRLRVSLPTYPFERKRFWLEAPSEEALAAPAQTPAREQSAPAPSSALAAAMDEPSTTMTAPMPAPSVLSIPVNRTARIHNMLVRIFEDLAGMNLDSMDGSATFLEMGFDSLFLTQVTQALQSKFQLKIPFRQLLGDLCTLRSLAEYVDGKLPPEKFCEQAETSAAPVAGREAAPPVVSHEPVAVPKQGDGDRAMQESALERLMREQLRTMNELFSKQLEALRGGTHLPAAAAPGPVALDSTTAAAVAPGASPPSAASVASPAQPAKEEFKPSGPYKPPQKGVSGGLTDRQRTHLQALIERYTARTAGSKRMTQEYRQVLADPRVVSGFRALWKEMVYPIVTVRSKGSRLWDVDGNEYIDILNGFGPIMLGHRPDFVEKAIEAQLHEGFELGPQTPLAGEVAKLFCDLTGNERMTFCNTGSEAVTAALRVARTVTGRNKVALFAGAYHGMFDEVLVKAIKGKAGNPQAAPVAPGIPREKVANITVLDYGAPEALQWIRENARDLAAVLVEPVQSRHPQLQPVEFLKEIRRITQEAGAALIFDEVVTGFRVHPGGCQALFGIRADLATYGKVVAGGMPIGILAGKSQFMDALDGGYWQFGDESSPEVGVTFFAGTFVRHPLTLAAVRAVLQHYKNQGPELQQGLNERTARMVRTINAFFEQRGFPTRLENFGSIFYFSFPPEEPYASLFYYSLRLHGLHVLEGFPCFLTTAHSDTDVEQVIQSFRESAVEMQESGFLPGPPESLRSGKEVSTARPMEKPAPAEAPVTEPQLEVWLSDQLGPEASCSYNESFSLHLSGQVDEAALKRALQQLVNRHEALRASFSPEGDRLRFAASVNLEIPTVDLTQLDAQEREVRVAQLIRNDAHTPFRLSEGPLVRAQLLKLGPDSWQLIFAAHHIVCDGWSTNVLLDELARIYNARVHGTEPGLPAPMSFAKYAQSQADFLKSPEGAQVEEFWLRQFRELPAPLNLPLDRPRPAVREFKGSTYRRKISAEAYNSIKKFGARQKCTLFVTLLSGLQILLSRLSGQEDVVVAIPTAGQSLLEDAVLVGHCVNFIPLRARWSGSPTAADFLAQTRQVLLEGYDHQNYTYGRLVRKLSIPRDPSRLPLTEIQFNLERVGESMRFEGLSAEVDPNPKSFVNFDIFLNVVEGKDGLVLDCDYNTGLFDEATMARWLGHYETVLLEMVSDVSRPVSELPLLTEAERRHLLFDCNATAQEFPRHMCVHQLLEAQAQATPEAVAACFEGEALTYAELDQRSNQLAAYLARYGVGPGVRVGVYLERSLDMLVSLLGVLKAGGAYVPMDPTYPAERISFVLADASVPVLLTESKVSPGLAAGSTRLVCLDNVWAEIEAESKTPPKAKVTSEDLAYVIYTSGSTGKPKGVEIQHRAVVNLLSSMAKVPGLSARDVLLAVTTLSFDIAGLELFLPLCVGAKLVIASREAAADGKLLLARLVDSGVTVMQATPVTWKLLLEAGWNGTPRLKALCGGEALSRELANELVRCAESVWNMYGPTETTIWSATVEVAAGEGPVRIGPPIQNTQFQVLDARGQLVPMGVPGELHIGGEGLATGYFRRPELTAEKFMRNPFSTQPESPLYKTGDVVRRLPDGTFQFLGRLDHQVKLRGFRIELGEIETVLGRYPGVREAVVMVREDVPGDKRLVAYVSSDQQALSVTAVREFLTGKLPNYMLPSAVVRLDAMPLTPNGKVDRKALPMPDSSRSAREREYVGPRTPQEKILAGIWAEVLHLDRVGIHDNLFELGADSLHIFQIAARAAKMGITIAPAQFLKHRTIAALMAQWEGDGHAGDRDAGLPRIVPVSREKYRVKQLIA